MDENTLNILDFMISVSRGSKYKKLISIPFRLISSILLEHIASICSVPIRKDIRLFWGDQMTVVLPDQISIMLYRYGFFEEEMTKALLYYLKPGMTFFDVGSHFGYCSLLASHLVGNNGQIHAFEPTTSTFKILESNLICKSNVYLNNVAVYSTETFLTLHDFGFTHPGFNSIYNGRMTINDSSKLSPISVQVRALTIDDYVRQTNSRPSFIKIDSEGAEFDVLDGMRQTITMYRPIVSIEVGDFENNTRPSNTLIKKLIALDYKPMEYTNGIFTEHQIQEKYKYTNIFCVPF